jgi:putative DNA primase/helicase
MSAHYWQAEVDAFIARFAERAVDWDDHPGDLEGDAELFSSWTDPHADEPLDATYRGGIIPVAESNKRPARPRQPLLDAALGYAQCGWHVLPCHNVTVGACSCGNAGCATPGKHPRTNGWTNTASRDPRQIRDWWRRWPNANIGIATGGKSGILVIDLDGAKGAYENFARIIKEPIADTYTVRSGSGEGLHFYFRWPDGDVDIRNSASKLAHGVDVRANGGLIIAPPSNHISGGYYTIEFNIELAAAPDWLVAALTEAPQTDSTPRPAVWMPLCRYGETALDNAVARITSAPDGQQRETLNREVYGIAQLVAGGLIPSALALESLQWAAQQMRSHDPRRPWRPNDVEKIVHAAFLDGLAHPRQPDRQGAPA